jgi:hypothetical protein
MMDATRQNFSSRIIHAYPYPYQSEAMKKLAESQFRARFQSAVTNLKVAAAIFIML